jgi:hypothetical protein
LKAPCFNPCGYEVKTWFQSLLFLIERVHRYTKAEGRELDAVMGLFKLNAYVTHSAESAWLNHPVKRKFDLLVPAFAVKFNLYRYTAALAEAAEAAVAPFSFFPLPPFPYERQISQLTRAQPWSLIKLTLRAA